MGNVKKSVLNFFRSIYQHLSGQALQRDRFRKSLHKADRTDRSSRKIVQNGQTEPRLAVGHPKAYESRDPFRVVASAGSEWEEGQQSDNANVCKANVSIATVAPSEW